MVLKIRSGNAKYTTKYLKLWSLLCIGSGPIIALCQILRFINGTCLFVYYIRILLGLWQSVFMGNYQLSRIYYCFSRNQVHSNQGYPNYIFIIMFGIGLILLIGDIERTFKMIGLLKSCGLQQTLVFFQHKQYYSYQFWRSSYIWYIVFSILYFVWEFGALLLYVIKICGLRRSSKADPNARVIEHRILQNLYRVCILTLLYQIPILILTVFAYISAIPYAALAPIAGELPCVLLSSSMYLMMDHNDKAYNRFLCMIHWLKLHYLCCCYRHIITKQVMDNDTKENSHDNTTDDVTTRNNEGVNVTLTTNNEINDISADHGRVPLHINEEITETDS